MVGLAQRALRRAKSRQPVRDAIAKCRTEIYEARKVGISWAVLYAQLTADGFNVGKGPSSLISAAKFWSEMDGISVSKPASSGSTKIARATAADFSDTRFASDWGQS